MEADAFLDDWIASVLYLAPSLLEMLHGLKFIRDRSRIKHMYILWRGSIGSATKAFVRSGSIVGR